MRKFFSSLTTPALCALIVALVVYPFFFTRREGSLRPLTPTQIENQKRRNAARTTAWAAIKSGDPKKAETAYRNFRIEAGWDGWDGFMCEAIAKLYIKNGDLENGRRVYLEALYPPPQYAGGTFNSSSLHWYDYAKLCDRMHLTDEANKARAHADALHRAAQK